MTGNLKISGDFTVSDGYHTMDELYEHRIRLWIALCRVLSATVPANVWKSRYHSDGSGYEGWFVLGYRRNPGKQITYHLPDREWDSTNFAVMLDRAPEFDGHESGDVLMRLRDEL